MDNTDNMARQSNLNMTDFKFIKHPPARHLKGSRLQPDEEGVTRERFSSIQGEHIVIEELLDGVDVAISFDDKGKLLLQSNDCYLTDESCDSQFDLLKQWATVHCDCFWRVLGCRYIMYGEWMYAKKRIYYDELPHYFMECDIFDRETGYFLDNSARKQLTSQMPICSVPVLAKGQFFSLEEVLKYLGYSTYITLKYVHVIAENVEKLGIPALTVCQHSDRTRQMKGIYIKVEEAGLVIDRLKFIRDSFIQNEEPDRANVNPLPQGIIIPNGLCVPIDNIYKRRYPTIPVENLQSLRECFRQDILIQHSLSKYPHEVSIVYDERCPKCGGYLIRMFYDSAFPGVLYFRRPPVGYLIICRNCKTKHSFYKIPDDH